MPFCHQYHYGPPPTLVRLKSESTPTHVRLRSEKRRCIYGAPTDMSCTT